MCWVWCCLWLQQGPREKRGQGCCRCSAALHSTTKKLSREEASTRWKGEAGDMEQKAKGWVGAAALTLTGGAVYYSGRGEIAPGRVLRG